MSVLQNSNAITPAVSGFELKSCRFNDSGYLSFTPSDPATSSKSFTISCWVKNTANAAENRIFTAAEDGASPQPRTEFAFVGTGQMTIGINPTGSTWYMAYTTPVYRDPSAWAHIVWSMDTSHETAANRSTLYVNGVEVTEFASNTLTGGTSIPQDSTVLLGQSGMLQTVGAYAAGVSGSPYEGYLAEMYFIDGKELLPSYFAATNEDTNQWQPKNPSDVKQGVTFGVNGFYLPFSNDALADSFTDADYHVPHTGLTAEGTAHTDTGQKKFGTASLECDGNSDYLRVPDSSDWTFDTGPFTIEAWVYNETASGTQRLFSHTSHSVNGKKGWNVILTSDSTGRFTWSTDGDDEESWNFANCMTQNTWTHFALTRTGTTLRAFKNGVMVDSIVDSDMTTIWNSPRDLLIGAFEENDTTLSGYWDGYIDEVRISNINRYSAGFVVPTAAFTADKDTKLLLHMDGSNDGTTFTDSSWTGVGGTGHTITPVGNATNRRISDHPIETAGKTHFIGPKVGSSAISFNVPGGSGNYLSVADSTDWNFGTGDFTLEGWLNTTWVTSNRQTIFAQYADGSNRWSLEFESDSRRLKINNDGVLDVNSSIDSFSDLNQWVHFAVVRASGAIKMFANGVSQTFSDYITPDGNWVDISAPLEVGRYGSLGHPLSGYLDELRISNSARYTEDFTPPTEAFTSDANTMLLIHSNTTMGSTTFTDSGPNTHTITANGDVVHVAPKIGTGMVRIQNGTNGANTTDWLDVTNRYGDWQFGLGSFTVEAWVCSLEAKEFVVVEHHAGAGTDGWLMDWDTSSLRFISYHTSGNTGVSASWSPTLGQWYSVCYVFENSNNTGSLYVDGSRIATGTISSAIDGETGSDMRIGSRSRDASAPNERHGFNGYFDEMRISRTARYDPTSTSYSVSTTAFTDDIDTVFLAHMDGGGGIDPETNLPILAGEGTYAWDASTNAIFYESGLPTNKSYMYFPGAVGDYLSIPDSSDWLLGGGTGDFTIEMWYYTDDISSWTPRYLGQYVDTNNRWYLGDDDGRMIFYAKGGGTELAYIQETNSPYQIRLGEWNHIAFVRDGSTPYYFVNGVSIAVTTAIAFGTMPDVASALHVGNYGDGGGRVNGALDQVRISDSARYTSSFTAPTTPFTADANTLLLLQSDFSEGGLGADHSGNYNYFTPTNLTADDMMEDSPMNNFCTMNSIDKHASIVLSEGNLEGDASGGAQEIRSTFAQSSGKWYCEYYQKASNIPTNAVLMGVGDTATALGSIYANSITYRSTGEKYVDSGTPAAYGSSWATGDIIGIAMNLDDEEVTFYKNNATQGAISFTLGTRSFSPYIRFGSSSDDSIWNFGQDSSFAGNTISQGNQDSKNKGDFYYTPPSGFLALCTDNLSTPSIALPGDHYNTITYDDGAGAKTGVGFQPDLVWLKSRGSTYNHKWTDSVRGVTKALVSDDPDAQTTDSTGLTAFGADGFTVGADTDYSDTTGTGMIAWNWKAGGAPTVDNSAGAGATPTAGSVKINDSNLGSALAGTIAATRLSANTTNGFSIVKYTGTGVSGATVAHGLSQAPELMLFKNTIDSVEWSAFSNQLTSNNNYLVFNTPAAQDTDTGRWNDTSPTASVFSLGDSGSANGTSDAIVTYCFHSVEGYSKVGSYVGNNNADGPFIYTGFRPAFVLIKEVNGVSNWDVHNDKTLGYNPDNDQLSADEDAIMKTNDFIEIISNGVKIRTTDGGYNTDGNIYMYYAIAHTSFKTANAR